MMLDGWHISRAQAYFFVHYDEQKTPVRLFLVSKNVILDEVKNKRRTVNNEELMS